MGTLQIPEGKKVVSYLSIGYLDDSLNGIETFIKAIGLLCENGKIYQFEYTETDMNFATFMQTYPDLTYYAHAPVHIYNELNYMDIEVAACMFDQVKSLFQELTDITLPQESYCSHVYHAMRDAMRDRIDSDNWDYLFGDYQCREDRDLNCLFNCDD